MLLPDHLVERLRPQPVGQRRAGGWRFGCARGQFIGKQVGHGSRP